MAQKKPATKKIKFLWDMVTGEFHPARTYALDTQSDALERQIAEWTKSRYAIHGIYAGAVTYTVDMQFNWHQDTPPDIRALETFWQMRQDGAPERECFEFYAEQVNNVVLLGENKASTPDLDAEIITRLGEYEQMREADAEPDDMQAFFDSRITRLIEVRKNLRTVKSWDAALDEALRLWVPPEWKLLDEMTPEEQADPN